jgi:hypothetical protein
MAHGDFLPRWLARVNVYRPTTDFSDLLRIVASYYDMYAKAYTYMGPWIAKQNAMNFSVPDKDEIMAGIGKPRSTISYTTYSKFIDALFDFAIMSKGRKALINPNPSTHHSAQFSQSTFNITPVTDNVVLRDERAVRKPAKTLHKIEFFGADLPVYIENLTINPDQIKFIILRPKLGKLGCPSTNKWEVLLYRQPYTYLIDHIDSNLNPRWSGIM